MWNTTLGCRVLKGHEARLVGDATLRLTDEIRFFFPDPSDRDSRPQLGIPIFDQLSPEQQMAMLDTVIGYLLDPDLEPPGPSAVLDATVAAIYANAFCEIEIELDSQRMEARDQDFDTDVRKSVVAALMEPIDGMDEEVTYCPDPECCDAEVWLTCIESLRKRVLADEDWLLGELTMDLPASASDDLKKKMGIDRDYFVSIPPDPTLAETRQAWANLTFKITGKRVSIWRFGDRPIVPVDLSAIVDEMDMELEDWCSYVNKRTGKVVSVPFDSLEYFETGGPEDEEEYAGDADDEMLEEARQIVEGEHYIQLPSKRELHEWEIMRDFSVSRVKPEQRDQLMEAIHGSGAFRFFRSTVQRLGLLEEWFHFSKAAKETFVMDWADAHEIAWVHRAEYRFIEDGAQEGESQDFEADF